MNGKKRKMVKEKNDGQKERVNRKQMRKIKRALPNEKAIEIIREEISMLVLKIW